MVTVEDILELSVFDSIWLAAPCEHYRDRPVISPGILDHEPFTDEYDVFQPNEFVFTSIGFADRDPGLADKALIELIERDVAGIAIKPVVLKNISLHVAEMSAQRHVPIFFYTGRLLERIIAAVMSLINEDEAESERTRIIDRILMPSDEREVRVCLFKIAKMTGATVQCIAASPAADDDLSLRATRKQLSALFVEYEDRWYDVERTKIDIYRDGLLGLISFKRPPRSAISDSEADLELCLGRIGALTCGIGQEVPLGEGDLTIRQARAALELARQHGVTTLRWSSMGVDAFRMAARTDRLFSQVSAFNSELLAEYDAAHGTSLSKTAYVFAECHGEVTATAHRLYQHRNTVHYRLRQIKDVLGFPDLFDHELAFFLMCIYI